MPTGMVYLIKAGDLYKIGRTTNLAFRLKSIGIELRMSIRLLHVWTTKTPKAIEHLFHQMMTSERICGEWFRLSHSQIEQLRTVSFSAIALGIGQPYSMPRKPRADKPAHPLRQWRERQGLSQAQVAEACQITQGMVSHIEQYRRIPLGASLEALLSYTGLPTDAFIRAERFLLEHPDFLLGMCPRKAP